MRVTGPLHLGDHGFVTDEEGGLAVRQEICLLGWCQGSVHADPDHTEPHTGMEERHERKVIGERDTQSISRPHPGRDERMEMSFG